MPKLASLLIALLVAGAVHATPAPVHTVDRVVAVVNKNVITERGLDARVAQIVANLKRQGVPLPPDEVVRSQVLERLINDEVQLQYAANNGIKVDDAELDRVIERLATQNHTDAAGFRKKLALEGTDYAAFRDELRQQITIDRLREREVDSKVFVADSEVDNYLASAVNAKRVEYRLAHILVALPEQPSPQDVERKQKRANEAAAKLAAGANFAQVAATYSDAPDGLSGGDLGWRSATRLPAPFLDQLDQLQPGQNTPVLRSAAGFHILKLQERRARGEAQLIEQVQVRHILVRTNEAISENDAKIRILQVRDRVLKGMKFDEAARLYSEDGSASRGGDLGWVSPGDMVPEFERAYLALKPGQLSEPVRSPFGWHLIEVLGSRRQDVGSERERQQVKQELRARKAEQAYADWARQLRDSAFVEERLADK